MHRRTYRLRALVVLCLWVSGAGADIGGPVLARDEWWLAWSWEPEFVTGAIVFALLYVRGMKRIGQKKAVRSAVRRRVTGFSGMFCLALAIMSPLDALAGALFSAHMAQHLVLTNLAAPLFSLGRPASTMIVGLPKVPRRFLGKALRVVRTLRKLTWWPVVALALHGITLWAWHLPAWYEAALTNDVVHWIEHGTLFGTAVWYWNVVVGERLRGGSGIVYLFAGAMQGALLGALITLAPAPWYTVHERGALAWNLTPLEDQQIAGLMMWVPAGLVYLIAVGIVFIRSMDEAERRALRREQRGREQRGREQRGGWVSSASAEPSFAIERGGE